MTTTNKAVIAIVTLVAVMISWVMYQNLVVIPRAELGYKMLQDEKREDNYKLCLSSAEIAYSVNWDAQCKGQGKKPDCLLPTYLANYVNETLSEAKKNCVTMYK